jgi:hypothetical protein
MMSQGKCAVPFYGFASVYCDTIPAAEQHGGALLETGPSRALGCIRIPDRNVVLDDTC